MDIVGVFHFATALLALATGAAVLVRARKGDRTHRRLGYVYVASMLSLNGSALLIYDLFGRWGPFHYAAVASLVTVLMGAVPVLRRRPASWRNWHYAGMCWSYAGLVAAGVSETLTRLPRAVPAVGALAPMEFFWGATAVGTAVVMGAAVYLIRVRQAGRRVVGR